MGGPCFIVNKDGEKLVGPRATDNFQIIPFTFRQTTWFSAEQCYQAMKFPEGSPQHNQISNLHPHVGESEWNYGIRVWECGQNPSKIVSNWEDTKVEIMYLINCAKYACNEVLQQQLLGTGDNKIVGMQSTWMWEKWNGLIQMLIRQKLKEGVDLKSIQTVSSREWSEIESLYMKRASAINILEKIPLKNCRNKLPFGAGKKYLIAVLHIIDEGRESRTLSSSSLVDRSVLQAKIAFESGADGVFLIIGEGGIRNEEVIAVYNAVRAVHTDRFIGINFVSDSNTCSQYLPDDADAIWTDFGVDRKGMSPETASLCKILFNRQWNGLYFGGFFFKGCDQRLPEEESRVVQFAILAQQAMHVCTVSGPGTGQPIAVETLARLYAAADTVR